MFAEELGGNASRKRAQENKERRKRLLQEQQQRKSSSSAAANATTSILATENVSPISSTTAATTVPIIQTPILNNNALTPSSKNVVTPRSSAVEKAAEQRQIRASIQAQNVAARKIQAILRRFLCRIEVRNHAIMELRKKISDLEMVQQLLQKKSSANNNIGFVPPAATVTALLRLFLIQIHPTQDTQLVQQLLQCTLIPSLQRSSASSDACILSSWLEKEEEKEYSVGRWRLQKLLESLLYYSTLASNMDVYISCLQGFLLESSKSLQTVTRSYLLQATASDRKQESMLDLIFVLRKYMLQFTDKPIPPNAESKRELCFRVPDKERAGALFQLLLKVVIDGGDDKNSLQLRARIVREILTIPLLSWRLTPDAIAFMAAPPSTQSTPRLILLLHALTNQFAEEIHSGELNSLLESNDLPITICGATGTQRLLANLMQCSRSIPQCNGTITTKDDFTSAASFFEFIAALVDAVPLGTFVSSRESVISWHNVDGNQKPIVLSSVILEHCKALVVDSYVRRLFLSAVNTAILNTDTVLETKTDKDLKHEKEFIETQGSSAASLAAKEARIDRNKSIWNSSKWAKNLSKGVSNLLSADRKGTNAKKEEDIYLRDNSAVSRKLATGQIKTTPVSTTYSLDAYDKSLLLALFRAYSIIIARWGGIGNDDLTTSVKRRETNQSAATSRQEACVASLFNTLSFSVPVVRAAWGLIQNEDSIVHDVNSIIDPEKGNIPVRAQRIQPSFFSLDKRRKAVRSSGNHGAPLLLMFLCCFSHVLIVTDDSELDMDRPLPMHQIRRCIQMLKKLLYRAFCSDKETSESEDGLETNIAKSNYFGFALIAAASRAMRDLYDRSSRKPMCVPSLWVISGLMQKEINQCKTTSDYQALVDSSPILRVCPYLVPFKRRLKLFDRIITTSRVQIQGENSVNPFHNNPLKPGIPVRITRGRILEDGLATMNNLGSNMRQRIAVQYYNEAGARETGIDAGGLFKDFWTDLCAIAFDVNYALFRVTETGSDSAVAGVGNCLYPNPSSAAAHGPDHTTLFAFLGRILGKAMFEGITIHPRFAHFFLSFLRGDYNFLHMLPDLSTVDPQLYQNLMFLKTYEGDAADLCLTFTVTIDDFGGTKEIPLIPNGENIEVDNLNKHRYIGLVAKYYVVDRVKEQSEAFTRGLWEVIDRSWLRMFNEPELQVLISGASEGKLDIEDMKANCQYAGGFTGMELTIRRFWNVVASFDEKQQGDLLRFVTGCERPPPLGFASMNPRFTIQRVGVLRDGDRLPTAATCFNVLKLPTYSSEKVMKQRLLYAIQSGAGFELT